MQVGRLRVGNFTKKQQIQKPKIYEKLNVSAVRVRVDCQSAVVIGRGVE